MCILLLHPIFLFLKPKHELIYMYFSLAVLSVYYYWVN